MFGGWSRPEDLRADVTGYLGRCRTDAARSRVDQHALPLAQAAHLDHRGDRRAVVDRQRGSLGESKPFRQRRGVIARHDDGLGLAAEHDRPEYPCSDLEVVDALSEARNLPGKFVPEDAGQLRRVRVEALAGEQVREVDPRRAYRNRHLTRAGLRVRALFDHHLLGTSGSGEYERTHGTSLVGSSTPPASTSLARHRAPGRLQFDRVAGHEAVEIGDRVDRAGRDHRVAGHDHYRLVAIRFGPHCG